MLENEVAEVQILTFIRDTRGSNFGFYIKYYDWGF
jgi:hypothetical protein